MVSETLVIQIRSTKKWRLCVISQMWGALKKRGGAGTSLLVQWLRLCASSARGKGLIPGRGTKIPHVTRLVGLFKKRWETLHDLILLEVDNIP